MLKKKVILKKRKLKSNLLWKPSLFSNLSNPLLKTKKSNFLENYSVASNISHLLSLKNVLFNEPLVIKSGSVYKIRLSAFYRTKSLLKYRKKIKKIFIQKRSTNDSQKLKKKFVQNYKSLFFKQNFGDIELICLNRFIDKKLVKRDYGFYKKYKHQLFTRNYNLWLDFIKVTNLVVKKTADISLLLTLFGILFKHLNKRKHNRFKYFVTNLFDHIIKNYSSQIKGLKLIISGRMLSKPRSSVAKIERGTLNLTCKDAGVCFNQMHVYTIYGAFGLKLYINYQK